MIAIVVGLVSLAVLVLAFLATKVWHWAHVLTLVVFYFAAVGYAILAARTLEKRLGLQKQLVTAQEKLEQTETLNDALSRGVESSNGQIINRLANQSVLAAEIAAETGDAMAGVVELEHKVRLFNRTRGRVWRNVARGDIDQATGKVTVGFPVPQPETDDESGLEPAAAPAEPAPLTLAPDAIVYVFEQGPIGELGPNGPQNSYIGEFRVDSVQGRTATLEPLDQLELDPYALDRLLNSRGPWSIYETMPVDDRDLFAGFSEDQLRAMLPPASVEEYLRDRTPTTPDDPPELREPLDADGNVLPPDTPEDQVATTQYRRRLRDYTLLLNDFERERAALVSREQALTSDIEKLNQSLEDAKRLEAYRQEELDNWQADLDAVVRDRRAIEAHTAALERQLANAKRLLEATLRENARLASARAEARPTLVPIGSGALDIDSL